MENKVLVVDDGHIPQAAIAKIRDSIENDDTKVDVVSPEELQRRDAREGMKRLREAFFPKFDRFSRLHIKGKPMKFSRSAEESQERIAGAEAKRERRRQRNIKQMENGSGK